jgi:squalene-hopene/tetraprenyl-beta-curcumene cyclase
LALYKMRSAERGVRSEELFAAARAGILWLLGLQNRDGGIPTFCRGWGALPFDRSSADITAHAIRCWLAWLDEVPDQERSLMLKGIHRAVGFLARTQRPDGAWAPLWFGNQFAPAEENLTYGTARVVCALAEIVAYEETKTPKASRIYELALRWLVQAQNTDGGWGGAKHIVSSTEETALAVEGLAAVNHSKTPEVSEALARGVSWLLDKVENGEWKRPNPIGFYFAKLWYYEKLYPQIFTVGALGRVAAQLPP